VDDLECTDLFFSDNLSDSDQYLADKSCAEVGFLRPT
jgi:hypothetical protein